MLSNNDWDDDWKEKKQKKKQRKKSQKDNNGQQSANSNDNEKDVTKTTESSFLQKSKGFGENQCFCCGNIGHCSGKRKHKDRPKNERAVHKGTAQVHNTLGTDVNDNNGQDDLISITSNTNNDDYNRNQNQNNNNDLMLSQASQEQSNLTQDQNSKGMALTSLADSNEPK